MIDRHRTTADEHRRMGDAAVFAADARVEPIAGAIIDMPQVALGGPASRSREPARDG